MKKLATNKAFRYSIYAALSVIFLSLFSTSTSPLTNTWGQDSAFFTLVGKGVTDGLLPYRDFFDMKGPYLFFFEYLGQLLHKGRMGAFILQSINLTACLWVTDSIYTSNLRLFSLNSLRDFLKLFAIGFAPVLAFAAFTFSRGNLTEELSLLFLLLSLKFMLSYFGSTDKNQNTPHPLRYGFLYGVFFGIIALIRITNAALIGAVLITVALELICSRQFRNLILNGLVFLGGIAVAFAPMVLFFYAKGLLSDMLYQVFVFGFTYSSEFTFAHKVLTIIKTHWTAVVATILPVFLTFITKGKNRKHLMFALCSFLFLMIVVCMGNGYLHYFALGIPNIIFGLCILLNAEKEKFAKKSTKLLTAIGCILILIAQLPDLLLTGGACAYNILGLSNDTTIAHALDIKSYIPEEDYDSIYAYTIPSCSSWYQITDLYPPSKYCDWQDHYMELSPEFKEELLNYIEQTPPKWIVITRKYVIPTEEINEILDTDYTSYAVNDTFRLYQRK